MLKLFSSTFDMRLLTPQGNALLGSQLVLAWVLRISNFWPSGHRLVWDGGAKTGSEGISPEHSWLPECHDIKHSIEGLVESDLLKWPNREGQRLHVWRACTFEELRGCTLYVLKEWVKMLVPLSSSTNWIRHCHVQILGSGNMFGSIKLWLLSIPFSLTPFQSKWIIAAFPTDKEILLFWRRVL